ncbi:unnamed protein product [Lactuca virosa]|uniref:Uncharacterized protein n=1 Tax=Lactuca virosa TaxID=75947 RepID=A0AAU9P2R0_9ASTR|nr:unnamed protein product [Lactuca virosa]
MSSRYPSFNISWMIPVLSSFHFPFPIPMHYPTESTIPKTNKTTLYPKNKNPMTNQNNHHHHLHSRNWNHKSTNQSKHSAVPSSLNSTGPPLKTLLGSAQPGPSNAPRLPKSPFCLNHPIHWSTIFAMLMICVMTVMPLDLIVSSLPFGNGTRLSTRKWNSVASSGNRILVGISQREVTGFYPILIEKKHELETGIKKFYTENVRMRFESESYTFDVYVRTDGEVKLLDFNPWCEVTLPLLFTWPELESESESESVRGGMEFRMVESECGVRPGLKTAVPYDYLDTSEGSGWDQFLRNADHDLRRQTR